MVSTRLIKIFISSSTHWRDLDLNLLSPWLPAGPRDPLPGQKKDHQFLYGKCSPNDQAGKRLDGCQETSVGGDISLLAAFEQLLYELINITVDMHTSLLRIHKHINHATHMQLRKLKLAFLLPFSERESQRQS